MNSYSQQESIKTNFYPHFVSETYQNWQTYNNDVFHLFPCDFTFKINWFRRRKWINAAADKIWRDGEALSHPSSENKALKQKQEIRLAEQMSRPDRQTQFASCQISFPDMWEFQGGVAASSVSSFSRPAVCSSWKVETGQRQVLSCCSDQLLTLCYSSWTSLIQLLSLRAIDIQNETEVKFCRRLCREKRLLILQVDSMVALKMLAAATSPEWATTAAPPSLSLAVDRCR